MHAQLTTTRGSQDEAEVPPATSGTLVDPEWLHDRLDHERVRLVDLRDAESYSERHVPGAVHLDLSALGGTRDGCDNVLLPPTEFERVMARLGISGVDSVVAYDDQWGLAAARLVWALHYYGHMHAWVLDGGWDRWQDDGGRTTDEAPPDTDGRFVARANPDVYADFDWVSDRVRGGDPVLLDTRSRAEFDQGHVPGAVCWDWFNAVPPGSWQCSRDSEALRSEWAALGVRPSDDVAVYCRSGMRAAHTYVVLKHAGYSRVRLYDGSWQDWSMRWKGADGS